MVSLSVSFGCDAFRSDERMLEGKTAVILKRLSYGLWALFGSFGDDTNLSDERMLEEKTAVTQTRCLEQDSLCRLFHCVFDVLYAMVAGVAV
jgi:hypothetical protein